MMYTAQKIELPVNPHTTLARADVLAYLNAVKTTNIFEHQGTIVTYSSDVWDFNAINDTSKGASEYKITFRNTPEEHIEDLKDTAIIYLKLTGKISSARKRVASIRLFLKWMNENDIYSFDLLTAKDLENYFEEKITERSISTFIVHRVSLKLFFLYQKLFWGFNAYDSIEDAFVSNEKFENAARMASRLPDIPKDYFNNFLAECVKFLNDESADLWLRGAACILVLLSQTGLRISEVLSLKINCIETIWDSIHGKKLAYLTYPTWKRVRRANVKEIVKTFVNEFTVIAVNTLTTIYAKDRERLGVSFLYLGGSRNLARNHYPVAGSSFSETYLRLGMAVNAAGFHIVDIKNEEWERVLSVRKITKKSHIQKQYPGTHTIMLPKFHQFRVYLCTALYEKGVSLEYIEEFMGHLSPAMESYYIRPKDSRQENLAAAKKILSGIVTGETRILGDTQGLTEKIRAFIAQGHYNVATDLEEIVNQLSRRIPIRQKTGGVCIKSSMLRECSSDAMTNEFYCAYGVCPNIFHFFYMVDISFKQCQELEETISYNSINGYVKQVEKETNMFRIVYEKKLVPEFKDLKAMIKTKGADYVRLEYPETAYFVDNIIEVEGIMDKWKMRYCKE